VGTACNGTWFTKGADAGLVAKFVPIMFSMPSPPIPPPQGEPDLRTLRLFDLEPHEVIVVRCGCGRITEYGRGLLQRLHRVPSDMLVYDLQFRLRCRQCNRTHGFAISLADERQRGNSAQPRVERVVVPKDG
jgi:hypothetical protein